MRKQKEDPQTILVPFEIANCCWQLLTKVQQVQARFFNTKG